MTPRRALALVVLGALLPGCTREISNPFASFETRCASLPPATYEVVATPLEFQEDDGVGIAELTTKSGSSLARHRTYGLTTANFGQQTETELRLVEQRATGRTCATPHVIVRLSMQPVVVYVARELAADACQHDVTREHELKHVAVNREALEDATRALHRDLATAMGTSVLQGSSGSAIAHQYESALRDYLGAFMREQHRALEARQAEVDSADEYARVSNACRAG
jgi:hypothetical protein